MHILQFMQAHPAMVAGVAFNMALLVAVLVLIVLSTQQMRQVAFGEAPEKVEAAKRKQTAKHRVNAALVSPSGVGKGVDAHIRNLVAADDEAERAAAAQTKRDKQYVQSATTEMTWGMGLCGVALVASLASLGVAGLRA